MRAEAEDIRAFIDKWHLNADNDSCENFTREEQMQMELDNPLSLNFEPSLVMNGKLCRLLMALRYPITRVYRKG